MAKSPGKLMLSLVKMRTIQLEKLNRYKFSKRPANYIALNYVKLFMIFKTLFIGIYGNDQID